MVQQPFCLYLLLIVSVYSTRIRHPKLNFAPFYPSPAMNYATSGGHLDRALNPPCYFRWALKPNVWKVPVSNKFKRWSYFDNIQPWSDKKKPYWNEADKTVLISNHNHLTQINKRSNLLDRKPLIPLQTDRPWTIHLFESVFSFDSDREQSDKPADFVHISQKNPNGRGLITWSFPLPITVNKVEIVFNRAVEGEDYMVMDQGSRIMIVFNHHSQTIWFSSERPIKSFNPADAENKQKLEA